jgi:hypothetical protein
MGLAILKETSKCNYVIGTMYYINYPEFCMMLKIRKMKR